MVSLRSTRLTSTSLRTSPVPLGSTARVALALGRLAGALSRRMRQGRGSALPGRVALRLVPDLLGRLAAGRTLVLVSGTNGKSTTTRLLQAALATRGAVVSNSEGSNMPAGLAATLIAARHAPPGAPVVLEVDERVLARAAGELRPRVLVLLNLSRDQLDRVGEVADHVRAWVDALRQVPQTQVVANCDDPLVVAVVLTARPEAAAVRWVAAGQPWRRDCPVCPICGNPWNASAEQWACPRCGFARPQAHWRLTGDRLEDADGSSLLLRLGVPGRANLANAALAVVAAECLRVVPATAVAALETVSEIDGRYLEVNHGGRQVRLLLAKNPAGWAEVLAQLARQPPQLVIVINARGADGVDTSWLWDVPFELLRGWQVVAAGERSADLSLRLLYAGVPHVREPDPLRALAHLPGPQVHLAANYTAFTQVRDQLRGSDRARA